MENIKIIQDYIDSDLKRTVEKNETFEIPKDISEERANRLIRAGVAKVFNGKYSYGKKSSFMDFTENDLESKED